MSFEKKTVYHSSLVAEGKIDVLITSDPMRSKFKKDQFFIGFKYEAKEHQLIIENDSIQKKLNGLKGHVVSLHATGSREDADIEVFDAAGPGTPQSNQRRAEQPPPPSGAPAQDGDVAPALAAKRMLLQHINARLLAMEAAYVVMGEWDGRHDEYQMTGDMFTSLVSNFYVSLDRSGLIAALPYEMIKPHQKPSPQPTAPLPRSAPPPAAPGPDDDEIPF